MTWLVYEMYLFTISMTILLHKQIFLVKDGFRVCVYVLELNIFS